MLPQSPNKITIQDLRNEFQVTYNYLSQFYAIDVGIPTSGTIHLSMFHGKMLTAIGNASWTIPPVAPATTFTLIVPQYKTFSIDVKGAGGGSSGSGKYVRTVAGGVVTNYVGVTGTAGTLSRVTGAGLVSTLQGNGGAGGTGVPAAGAAGTGTGGQTNATGGGSAGGASAKATVTSTAVGTFVLGSGAGGAGGRAVSSWNRGATGAPLIGGTLTVTIGTRGAGGAGNSSTTGSVYGLNGTHGSVLISWT